MFRMFSHVDSRIHDFFYFVCCAYRKFTVHFKEYLMKTTEGLPRTIYCLFSDPNAKYITAQL